MSATAWGSTRYDVVIVGAGLAGLQCANLLAEKDLSVLLVDRKGSLTESVHTTGIFVRRTLEDFDLPIDCLGPPLRRVLLYSPRGRSLTLQSRRDEFRVGRMGKLYESMLEASRGLGVEWVPRTRYVGLREQDDHSIVALENGSGRFEVQARFVVGADGAISRVAKDLGLDSNTHWIVGVEDVMANVPLDGEPGLHCFLDPKLAPGYIAWVLHDGDEVHLGVGGYPSRFVPAKALEEFRRGRASQIIDVDSGRIIERRGGRIPVGGVLRNLANKRGLLVGDAAGAVSPLTAGGLDPCMRLSTLAARVSYEYLESADERALGAYSGGVFRSRFRKRLSMRRAISSIESPRLLEIGCALARYPGVRRLAADVFFGDGSFPLRSNAQAS